MLRAFWLLFPVQANKSIYPRVALVRCTDTRPRSNSSNRKKQKKETPFADLHAQSDFCLCCLFFHYHWCYICVLVFSTKSTVIYIYIYLIFGRANSIENFVLPFYICRFYFGSYSKNWLQHSDKWWNSVAEQNSAQAFLNKYQHHIRVFSLYQKCFMHAWSAPHFVRRQTQIGLNNWSWIKF